MQNGPLAACFRYGSMPMLHHDKLRRHAGLCSCRLITLPVCHFILPHTPFDEQACSTWLHPPCMRLTKRMKEDLARPYLPFSRLLSCASARAAAPSACAKSAQPMPARARAPPAQELAACARKGSFRSMRPEKPSHAAAAARSARPASTAAATSAPCSTAPPAYPRCSLH